MAPYWTLQSAAAGYLICVLRVDSAMNDTLHSDVSSTGALWLYSIQKVHLNIRWLLDDNLSQHDMGHIQVLLAPIGLLLYIKC